MRKSFKKLCYHNCSDLSPFTVWIVCSSEIWFFLESRKSESQKHYKFLGFGLEFSKIFSTHFSYPQYPGKIQNYIRTFFFTVGQNNYYNKILFIPFYSFGVCCLFIVTATSTTIDQNCTYIQNPSFPAVYSAATALAYTINKCSSDVCSVRLDFETFQVKVLWGFSSFFRKTL